MEWRCEWCGKPHAADDPPCDNCGHGTFERAVVQSPTDLEATTLWVCTACGREHPKHTPPCSRCGNATLERREHTVDEADLTAPGYLDLLTPRYALGFALVVGLGVVLALGLVGIVDLPGMGQDDIPHVSDVPGDSETIDGYALAAVEEAYVQAFNDRRAAAGAARLERSTRLDEIATFYTQRRVRLDFAAGRLPADDRMTDLLEGTCSAEVGVAPIRASIPEGVQSATDLAHALVEQDAGMQPAAAPAAGGLTGVGAHAAPDGSIYLTQFTC